MLSPAGSAGIYLLGIAVSSKLKHHAGIEINPPL
jgi:hypothetical protein